jgi:hypothetical protein
LFLLLSLAVVNEGGGQRRCFVRKNKEHGRRKTETKEKDLQVVGNPKTREENCVLQILKLKE